VDIAEHTLEPSSRTGADASHRERYGSVTTLPRNLIRVPSVKQRTDFSCGNAATLAVLRYWRWDRFANVDEAALYAPLETSHAKGTEPQPITSFLNAAGGITAEYRHGDVTVGDLERAVDLLEPPIVDLQAWRDDDTPWRDVWDAGHYLVMVGYDDERLFFMDPCTMTPGAYAYLPRAELADRWHDLSGDHNERIERMAIFVRGSAGPRIPDEPAPQTAARLG
jgi:ABC-type bacteriocin/lantibiotic exporter with double-glycine peptidase domain